MSEIVVVDTNIIISALISGNEDIIQTLSRPGISFVSSSFAFVELFKHSPRIQEKSKLQQDELLNLLRILLDLVDLVDEAVVSLGSWVEASRLCSEVDPNDISFVALALELQGKLWTNDELLRIHLISMGYSSFFNSAKSTFLN